MTAYPYSILNGNGQSKFQPLPSQPRVYGMPGSINAHVGTYQHVIADGNGSSSPAGTNSKSSTMAQRRVSASETKWF